MRPKNRLEYIFDCLIDYWRVWFIPMILGVLCALGYAIFLQSPSYTARQSVVLRDDLLGAATKPSRYESLELLKSAQELVLEVARKPEVVRAVLEELGPTATSIFGSGGSYPSQETIEEVQGNISFSGPNGVEFAKTDTFVVSVKTSSPDRSKKFVSLLLDQVDVKLNEVRKLRLTSMRNELSQASEKAEVSLAEATDRLQNLEEELGVDLTILRGLNSSLASGGWFERNMQQIQQEHRAAVTQLASAQKQRDLVTQAIAKDEFNFVSSRELLELQPALRGYMQQLSEALGKLANSESTLGPEHPTLIADRQLVNQLKQQLRSSLNTTVAGLDSQIAQLQATVDRHDQAILQLEVDLKRLAKQRVNYAALDKEVEKRTEAFNNIQTRLGEIQSYAELEGPIELLQRIGNEPQVGTRPDGIGKKAIVIAGAIAGLMVGLGIIMLVAPPYSEPEHDFQQDTAPPAPVPNVRPEPQPEPAQTDVAATNVNPPADRSRQPVTAAAPAGAQSAKLTKPPQPTAQAQPEIPSGTKTEAAKKPEVAVKAKESTLETRLRTIAGAGRSASKPTPKPKPTPAADDAGGAGTKRSKKDSNPAISSVQEKLSSEDVIAALKASQQSAKTKPATVQPERRLTEKIQDAKSAVPVRPELKPSSKPDEASEITSVQNIDLTVDKIDMPALEKLQDGETEPRVPSLSDYAKTLDNPKVTQTPTAHKELLDPRAAETSPKASTTRPIDIAKSLQDQEKLDQLMDEISKEDQLTSRLENAVTLVTDGAPHVNENIDDPKVKLIRRNSDIDPMLSKQGLVEELAPEETLPDTAKKAKQPPRKRRREESSNTIPQQIRQLSDSISSFARPNSDSQFKKPDEEK